MKTIFFSLLTLAGVATVADAQVLSQRAARNALVGGIAGAIIGENNHHQALEGAAIGAAAGLIWTAATEPRTPREVSYSAPAYCEPTTRVIVQEPDYHRKTVVVHRPVRTVVVHRPATRTIIVHDHHAPVRHVHRKVVKVVEPGCSPRYVQVID